MIIDFHTHAFPDKIAARTIEHLETVAGEKAFHDGRLASLLQSEKRARIDISLVLPVMTRPEQFDSVNAFAKTVDTAPGVRSFAGIHPLCDDMPGKLDRIAEAGFKGVKIHPDYQSTDITDEGYIKIMEGCRDRGLFVITHAGMDPVSPGHVHCPPDVSAEIVRSLTKDRPFIILAHMGGMGQIDLVEKHLIGLPCYLDLSYVLFDVGRERAVKMIRAHGADRILFGTDSPWRDQSEYLSFFDSLSLTAAERETILFSNAAKILCIPG